MQRKLQKVRTDCIINQRNKKPMLLNEPRCQRLLIQPNIFKNGRREISRKKNLKVQSAQSKEEFNSTCIQHHKSMNRTMKINDEQNFRKQTNQKPNQINLKPLGWFGTGTTLEAMSDDSWWWAISDPRHQDHRSEPKTSLFSLSLSLGLNSWALLERH